jgi:copper resistance protein C
MLKRLFVPLVIVGMIVSGQALALTGVKLKHTSPADGATVAAPAAVSLTFDEPIQLLAMTLTHNKKRDKLNVSRIRNAMTVSVPVKNLEPGLYTVQYSGMARSSGHFVSGTFSFTVSN